MAGHCNKGNTRTFFILVLALISSSVHAKADIGSPYGPPVDRPAFARETQNLIANGDPVTASNLLNQIDPADLHPRELKWFHHVRCYAAVEMKDYARAIQHCSTSLHNSNEFWQDFVNRGSAYAMLGEYDLAVEDYRSAIRRGGNHDRLRRVIRAIQEEAERPRVNHPGQSGAETHTQ